MNYFYIHTGEICNNNCVLCFYYCCKKRENKSGKEIINLLVRAEKNEERKILVSGGEVTIRKDFLQIISAINNLKFKLVKIKTNGRMFSYENFVDKIKVSHITYFDITLYSHDEKEHDKITNINGSFKQTINGIKNLLKYKRKHNYSLINIIITIVVYKGNYTNLKSTIINLKYILGINEFKIIFVYAIGGALLNYRNLIPNIKVIYPYIIETILYAKNNKINLYLENIPIYDDLFVKDKIYYIKIDEDIFNDSVNYLFKEEINYNNNNRYGIKKKDESIRNIKSNKLNYIDKKIIIKNQNNNKFDNELIAVKNKCKPILRTLLNISDLEIYKKRCEEYKLNFIISDKKFTKNSNDNILIINSDYNLKAIDRNDDYKLLFASYNKRLINNIESIEYKSYYSDNYSKKLGFLLGYPNCCIDFFIKNKQLKNSELIFKAFFNSKKTSYLLNILDNDVQGLISHFPCSFNCIHSIHYAKKIFNILLADNNLHTKIYLNEYFNFLKGFYFYFINGCYIKIVGEMNDEYINYDLFYIKENSSKKYYAYDNNINDLFRKITKYLNKGNKFVKNNNLIQIFKNNDLIYNFEINNDKIIYIKYI
jgi:MoaA/NifB/PqqE/SkfB family radical SAM enzyme